MRVQATGAVGPAIVKALCDAGYDVQVISRKKLADFSSKNVKVIELDYSSLEELEAVLKGQDAVVSALGPQAADAQTLLIQAAVSVGVKRFIPSEFGSDTIDDHIKTLPPFGFKVEAQDQLKAATEKQPAFTYTLIFNGPFLDWGISTFPFLINVQGRKVELYDGGDVPFSTTRVTTVGKAVAACLRNFEATKNRVVRVHDAVVTQNQLVALAEKEVASPFTITDNETKTMERKAWEMCKDSSINPTAWIIPFILVSIWGEHGGRFKNTDNELLGIQELKGSELDRVLIEEIQKVSK